MRKHNHLYSIMSQDVSNDPPHKGYIEGMKLLETPKTI